MWLAKTWNTSSSFVLARAALIGFPIVVATLAACGGGSDSPTPFSVSLDTCTRQLGQGSITCTCAGLPRNTVSNTPPLDIGTHFLGAGGSEGSCPAGAACVRDFTAVPPGQQCLGFETCPFVCSTDC